MNQPNSPWIVDATDATFASLVIEGSHAQPVIVDFWSQTCQPCRILAPMLEQLVAEREGQVLLVKANTQDCPGAAQEFQVSGIPAVYGLVGGEVVDFFTGVIPLEELTEWIDRVVLSGRVQATRQLEDTDPAAAEAAYRALEGELPDNPHVTIALSRVLVAQDKMDEARELIDDLEKRGFLEPEAKRVKAQLELGNLSADTDVTTLRAATESEPDNLDHQVALARGLLQSGEYEESLQVLLAVVQHDRKGPGETARQLMLDVFQVLPDDSELIPLYRRQLAMALC